MVGVSTFEEINQYPPGPRSTRLRLPLEVEPRAASAVCAVPAEAEVFQRKLDETTRLLRELQDAQNERLSTRPPPNTICLLGPSYRELHLGRSLAVGAPGVSVFVFILLFFKETTFQDLEQFSFCFVFPSRTGDQ